MSQIETLKHQHSSNLANSPIQHNLFTMVSFEWDPDHVPVTKLSIHCAQIVLAFVGWCLQLAVFTGDGSKIIGDNGWNFGVVSRPFQGEN